MKQGILALLSAIVVATSGLSAQETEIPAVMTKKEMRRMMRGYKAFYEIGYDFDSRAAGERFADVSKFETVFVQGFQFNNYFFLGGGAGLNFFTGKTLEALAIPCFVDMRVNLLNKAVTPFFDAVLGLILEKSVLETSISKSDCGMDWREIMRHLRHSNLYVRLWRRRGALPCRATRYVDLFGVQIRF